MLIHCNNNHQCLLQHRHLSQPGYSSSGPISSATTNQPTPSSQVATGSPTVPGSASTGTPNQLGHVVPIRFSISRQLQPNQTPTTSNTSVRAQVHNSIYKPTVKTNQIIYTVDLDFLFITQQTKF